MIHSYLAGATAVFFSLSIISTNYGTPGATTGHPGASIESHRDQGNEGQSNQNSETPELIGGASSTFKGIGGNDSPILSKFFLDGCRVTQGEDGHITAEGGHSYATDIACTPGIPFDVKSPNFKPYYVLAYIGEDKRLGNYVVLRHGEERYIFGHTKSSRKVGEKIYPNETIGQTDNSGHTTGNHVHVEYWHGYINRSLIGEKQNNAYSRNLCDQREWRFCDVYSDSKQVEKKQEKAQASTKQSVLQKYYFTHYDLGDVSQNDSAPCHGASGADLCFLAREGVNTMALTVDIRNKLGVKWGDKVILEGDAGCRGIYEVHDEMNPRYRTSCVKRPGTNYCIKGDLPGKPGGACTVKKIKY